MGYVYLLIAIVAEVIGTSALKAAEGFTRPVPSLVVVAGYGAAFYFLGLVLRTIPVGFAYAIWAGLGIVLITLVGMVAFRQAPDLPAVLGMGLIIAGVLVIHLFSRTVAH
jgi:small multidrug resistance pump